MVLVIIGGSVLLQIGLYLLLDKVRYGKTLTLLLLLFLLFLHLYLLPTLLSSETPPSGEQGYVCGLAAIAYYVIFWIFGAGLTLITHVCYFLVETCLRLCCIQDKNSDNGSNDNAKGCGLS